VELLVQITTPKYSQQNITQKLPQVYFSFRKSPVDFPELFYENNLKILFNLNLNIWLTVPYRL
jgi:hypothetical protein